MRKFWKRVSQPVKIVSLIVFGFLALGAGFLILTITGEIEVKEAISIKEPLTFTAILYPNQTLTKTYTIENVGPEVIEVSLNVEVSPDNQGVEAEISPEEYIKVPGEGTAQFTLTVKAESNVVPGKYTVTVELER